MLMFRDMFNLLTLLINMLIMRNPMGLILTNLLIHLLISIFKQQIVP